METNHEKAPEILHPEQEKKQPAAPAGKKKKRFWLIVLLLLAAAALAILLLVPQLRLAHEQKVQYQAALQLTEDGKFYEAYLEFQSMGDYRDCEDRLPGLRVQMMKQADAGSLILYGTWEQDGNLQNGAEDLCWQVLDRRDGHLLVISRDILEYRLFSEMDSHALGWTDCGLHSWLNEDFLQEAFQPEERELISLTQLPAAAEDAVPAEDRIFLLSADEAKNLFSADAQREAEGTAAACQTMPEETYREGVVVKEGEDIPEQGSGTPWWLRSTEDPSLELFGDHGNGANVRADFVAGNGSIVECGMEFSWAMGVRPAMWISLKDGPEEEPWNSLPTEPEVPDETEEIEPEGEPELLAWFPEDAPDCELLGSYEDRDDFACPMIFCAQTTLRDFRIVSMEMSENDDGLEFVVTGTLQTFGDLEAGQGVKAELALPGLFPTRGVTYVDKTGKTRVFSVNLSNLDGSLCLREEQQD